MGQAREVMDRLTAAMTGDDEAALRELYAADAVGDSPDLGRLEGGAALAEYMIAFKRAFPDATYEPIAQLESGDVAVDEGYLVGTHTGVLAGPAGELAPTGKSLRLRSCDVLTVKDGKAVSHRFYFDQVDLARQLGIAADTTVVLPDAQRTAAPAR